jgi:alpha-L-rhamnosidase
MLTKQSKWIGCGKEFSAPFVIKKFTAKQGERAVIDICGLGYYELFINGVRVGEEFFKPAVSDYSERDFTTYDYPLPDKTSHTIYYNTYDVTAYIKEGENELAVLLGNGFYRQLRRTCEGNTWFNDELILRFELALGDRKICTDGTEKAVESFIKENNLFYGEEHDYAALCGKEIPVCVFPAPKAKLLKQRCPKDKITCIVKPILVSKKDGRAIYDVGENISGFVCLKPTSALVQIRHAEVLKNGELDFESSGGWWQVCVHAYKNAQNRVVHPWFSWAGFRYFEIEGEAEDIEVCAVWADVKKTAVFECGNQNLNWLFDTFLHTQLCNMHGGVPSDCPHRERLGYTGDGQLAAEAAMLFLSSRSFYEKWIRDIADCQDVTSGHVQHTAPFFGGGGGPGGWGGAMVLLPYTYYKVYGDKKILEKYFDNMLAFLRCMQGFREGGLVVREREGGWCLGDWCTPDEVRLPEAFVNTFYYIRCMQLVQKSAQIIGKSVDYSEEIAQAKASLHQAYFDKHTGDYCQGVQGANAFALLIGLGDERTKKNLLSYYKKRKTFDTGIFGTDILAEYLVQSGEIQLLFDLLSGTEYPSFGYMKVQGSTTLWENWAGENSLNHPMFGACVKQFLYGFLGLSADVGFENINLSPQYIEGIDFIRAKIKFPKGTLQVECSFEGGRVALKYKTTGKIKVRI